jgi:hypothetical protein
MGCVFYFHICWKTEFQISNNCIGSVLDSVLPSRTIDRVFMSWSDQAMTYFSVI